MVTHELPCVVLEILEYLDASGSGSSGEWFNSLNAPVAAKVITAIARLAQRNLSNVKGFGGRVFESKINFGPGRVTGSTLVDTATDL